MEFKWNSTLSLKNIYTKYNLLNKSSPNLNINALFRLINAVRRQFVQDLVLNAKTQYRQLVLIQEIAM